MTSIKSIEVTQRQVGQGSKAKKAFWWFIVMKSGSRYEEPGAGSDSLYDADHKAIKIREFLGVSFTPTAQDTDGSERGIGEKTMLHVLGQLDNLDLRQKD